MQEVDELQILPLLPPHGVLHIALCRSQHVFLVRGENSGSRTNVEQPYDES